MAIPHIFGLFIAHHLERRRHGDDRPLFRTVPKGISPFPGLHKVKGEQRPKGVASAKRFAVRDQNNGICPLRQISSSEIHEEVKRGADNSTHCSR